METKISPLLPEHYEEVIHISNLSFGKGYYSNSNLPKHNDDGNFSLVALKDNKVAGFTFMKLVKAEIISNELQFNSEELSTLKGEVVGLRKSTAISPEHQGKGIGSQLISIGNEVLFKNSNTALVCIWKNDRSLIKRLYEKEGFTTFKHLPYFWKKESREQGFHCIQCGQPPCNCSSIIMIKRIH